MMLVREHRYKPEDILLTWQIASSLSHHPHWYMFNRLTASCSQDQVVLQLRKLWQGHDDDVHYTSRRVEGDSPRMQPFRKFGGKEVVELWNFRTSRRQSQRAGL